MMFERGITTVFHMSPETWRRHANPYSVWTRIITVLPLLILAFWSRKWVGWWSLIPIVVALLWMWLNPRVFPPPKSTYNWSSKAVLGERVWINRKNVSIPAHHRILPHILSGISFAGLCFVVWGIVAYFLWPIYLGLALGYLGKLWFVDRMVWLYEEMKDATPEYRSWLYEKEEK